MERSLTLRKSGTVRIKTDENSSGLHGLKPPATCLGIFDLLLSASAEAFPSGNATLFLFDTFCSKIPLDHGFCGYSSSSAFGYALSAVI